METYSNNSQIDSQEIQMTNKGMKMQRDDEGKRDSGSAWAASQPHGPIGKLVAPYSFFGMAEARRAATWHPTIDVAYGCMDNTGYQLTFRELHLLRLEMCRIDDDKKAHVYACSPNLRSCSHVEGGS